MNGVLSLVLAGVIIVSGAACMPIDDTSVAAATDSPATLRSHGEQVFRLQNAALDRLIEVAGDDVSRSEAEWSALAVAEDDMVSSCRDLNEAAGLHWEGKKPGRLLQLRILGSLAACEETALAAHKLTNPSLKSP